MQVTSSLACPVLINNLDAHNWGHDLWKINDQILAMGVLQPALPPFMLIPQIWQIVVIDLKDCSVFFTIPLNPDDTH